MKTTTTERRVRLVNLLLAMGFSYEESVKLRRIERTLHRWAELECGTGNGQETHSIERDEETNKPFRRFQYPTANGYHDSRYPVADREAGALKRLAAIMAVHPKAVAYHQGDTRGCALYIVSKADLNGSNIDQVYTRGVAVCD